MRVREGTGTIMGSHPHSRWSVGAQGHHMLSPYQASYPAILNIATSMSLKKLLGRNIGSNNNKKFNPYQHCFLRKKLGL